ncbi:MAG: AMP-binding protein, partial [Pseudonocardiaceae bacterium]
MAGHLAFDLGYDPRLFDAPTVTAMAERLRLLLVGMADEPDRSVSQLPWMSADEQRQVLVGWNDTAREVPECTIVELFQAQVARSPDAVAVSCGDACLSYAELDQRVTRLARMLIGLGAGPERFVALMVPRSADMVVAVMAVWQAGAAYLPIDPAYPAERIGFMLSDTRPVLMVTTTEVGNRLPEVGPAVPRLRLDDPQIVAALADGD